MKSWVIAIDGPAASGKTSVSRELARRLGCRWVSTGAFYRGLALVAHELGVTLTDPEALARLSKSTEWQVRADSDETRVFFHKKDVTSQIMSESNGNRASQVSRFPEVRESLLALQRDLRKPDGGLIAEGRDCGSVVFPDAILKVYLTARSGQRAQRRAMEKGQNVEDIARAQRERDRQDQERVTAPLQVPEGASVLDTSELNFEEVVAQIEAWAREKV